LIIVTPGEAKSSYSFVDNIILKLDDINRDELNIFLYNFYNSNRKMVNYDNLLFLIGKSDKFKYLSNDCDTVMKSFIDYSIKNDTNKDIYIKHLRNILCYICDDENLINKIIDVYINYGDELKRIEKSKNEEYISSKLDNLIGLENVKNQIKQLSDWAYIMKLRKDSGLKVNDITMHMVFTGSPGTGKTTIARIIADLYYKLGIIEENKLIEVAREDLVAEYLGQSEIKTKEVLEKSKGGVLFIDEAYSLTKNNDEYGVSVVNTILKFMEDNRDNTVIIVAGYQKEIEQFINSNPGLKSRFNTYLKFDNYNSKELLEILKMMIKNNDYTIDDNELDKIFLELEKIDTSDISFSNARYIRNLFEKAIKNQASRLVRDCVYDKCELQRLIYLDFFK